THQSRSLSLLARREEMHPSPHLLRFRRERLIAASQNLKESLYFVQTVAAITAKREDLARSCGRVMKVFAARGIQPAILIDTGSDRQSGRANDTISFAARWFVQKSLPSKVSERQGNGTRAKSCTSGVSCRGSSRPMHQSSFGVSFPRKT